MNATDRTDRTDRVPGPVLGQLTSGSDHPPQVSAGAAPTTEPPATRTPGAAAASSGAYNASTAQKTATELVRLLMEQLGFAVPATGGLSPGKGIRVKQEREECR